MEAYKKRTQMMLGVVSKIAKARTLDELRSGVTAFIEFSDANPKLKSQLCDHLVEIIIEASKPYISPLPSQNKNIVFVPPDAAPVVMIPNYVPIVDSEDMMYDGSSRLLAKISEFSDPMEDAATEEEMNAVLDSAQTKFKVIDIVAPSKPLMILSFDNTHAIHNCECGVSDPSVRQSVILVYHPRDVSGCDRVFIFAHEIGHALHFALTGNIDVVPDRFDAFNEALGINFQTIRQKQEAFADVAAFAMLNNSGLKKHLPHQFSDTMLGLYDRYIGYVTGNHMKP